MDDMKNGLYSKYRVTKADGTPLDGDCFVLRPDRDSAARCALKEYAYQTPNDELASDVEDWLDRIGALDYTTREAEEMIAVSKSNEIATLRAENERLRMENARLRREMEAIEKQIKSVRPCKMCVNRKDAPIEGKCLGCNRVIKQNYEWARPCAQNGGAL